MIKRIAIFVGLITASVGTCMFLGGIGYSIYSMMPVLSEWRAEDFAFFGGFAMVIGSGLVSVVLVGSIEPRPLPPLPPPCKPSEKP